MSDRVIDLLGRLSGRERGLLALLFAVILPLALWFGWLAPLSQNRTDALAALKDARALEAWVNDRAAENALLRTTTSENSPPPIGASGVEQRLITAGLRDTLSGLSDPGDGTLSLRFDAVSFAPMILWLSDSDPVWGYSITSFRFDRADDPGLVSAEITLSPRGK